MKILALCFLFILSFRDLKSQNHPILESCNFYKIHNKDIYIEIDSTSNIFEVFNSCNSFEVQILFIGSVEVEGKQTKVLIRGNSCDSSFSILSSRKSEMLSISFDSFTIGKILGLPEESWLSYCYKPSSKMEQGGIFIKLRDKLIYMAQSRYNRFDKLNLEINNKDVYFLYINVVNEALKLLVSTK